MTKKNPLTFCPEFLRLSENDKEAVHLFVREHGKEDASVADYMRQINIVAKDAEFLDEARKMKKLWDQSGESAKYVTKVLNRQAAADVRRGGYDNL